MEYCVIPRQHIENAIDSMESVVLDASTPKSELKFYIDIIANLKNVLEFTVSDSLTMDDVWRSEEIMSLNGELLHLDMSTLMKVVGVV